MQISAQVTKLTLADPEAIELYRKQTRNATIEECARVADRYGGSNGSISIAIRALKDKP